MERKSSKDTQLSFWWKAKSSSYVFAFEDFNFVVGSAANSVGTTLEFAVFPTPNIAELVPSGFFSDHNYGFCGGSTTFSQEKYQHFHVVSRLDLPCRHNRVRFSAGTRIISFLFSFCLFLFNDLNESIFTN